RPSSRFQSGPAGPWFSFQPGIGGKVPRLKLLYRLAQRQGTAYRIKAGDQRLFAQAIYRELHTGAIRQPDLLGGQVYFQFGAACLRDSTTDGTDLLLVELDQQNTIALAVVEENSGKAAADQCSDTKLAQPPYGMFAT